MNTGKLKTFAQQSRRILMEGVKQKLLYWGFNAKGEVTDELTQVSGGVIIRGEAIDDPTVLPKWEALRDAICRHGINATIEEAAYTWFNRMMAIRILGKNGYDPAQLEYEDAGSRLPVIVAKARRGMATYLNKNELGRLQLFLTDYSQETRAFAILITGYCHSHGLLNRVFGRLNDYTELLLPDNILAPNGFIHLLNTTDAITDDDYLQVELIGWLYQFYISEKKDEVFAGFKKNQKARPEDIPAATQIFTPNWIVKYMVQNTAGRIWLDHHPDSKLRETMKYLVEAPEETSDNETNSNASNPPTEGESPLEKGGGPGTRDGGLGMIVKQNPPESPFAKGGPAPMKQPDLFSETATSGQLPPFGGTEGGQYAPKSQQSIPFEAPKVSPLRGDGRGAALLPNGDPIHFRFLDPATGSGHILVEGFSLLYEMYMEEYYLPADAVENILTKNLFGLELDLRAAQLARFAVLLAAAKKTPEILEKDILPRIYAMPEPAVFSRQKILDFLGSEGTQHEKVLTNALQLMQQAQNLGSVMQFKITATERDYFKTRRKELHAEARTNLTLQALEQKLEPFLDILFTLTRRYEAIAANPPYMGSGNMNDELKEYINDHYPNSKSDLMTVFMELAVALTKSSGQIGMINLPSWMFLTSFEKLRVNLINEIYITSLIQNGRGIFGSDFGSVCFCIEKNKPLKRKGIYRRLFVEHVKVDSVETKEKRFLDKSFGYYVADQSNFSKIPGYPFAYWVSYKIFESFKYPSLGTILTTREGMATADNDRFLRYWNELSFRRISFDCFSEYESEKFEKWFPYNKGGVYRKWYGNNEYCVEYENQGFNIKNNRDLKTGRIRSHNYNGDYGFKQGITWSALSSGNFSVRFSPPGFLFDSKGAKGFSDNDIEILGLLNSIVSTQYLKILSPTVDFKVGDVILIPFYNLIISQEIKIKSLSCINISRNDWDSSETSWDFQINPLLQEAENRDSMMEESFKKWQEKVSGQFYQLHANEEELNRIFIEIYGLSEELDPVVPLKDITILQEELDRTALEETDKELRRSRQWRLEDGKWLLYVNDELVPPPAEGELPACTVQPALPIKKEVVARQFISYAIGCMMGRYSLQKPGLILANQGETLDDYVAKVQSSELEVQSSEFKVQSSSPVSPLRGDGRGAVLSFHPDDDAIIPLMGTNCGFADDALFRLRHFIEVVWGGQSLTQNINFLQSCLDMELEKYLTSQNNFWKDHCSRYKKKPIYWLFSSPTGAFQVLTYMHRMNRFTVQKIRDNYLLRHIQWLGGQISQMESRRNSLVRDEQKKLDWMIKAQKECEAYDLHLKDIADKFVAGQITIDLDDGVSVNYPKFEPVVAGIK
jgi:hypothetical protein